MDEGDGVALMDPDLPPDNALMDKSASVQVGTHARTDATVSACVER